MEFKKLRLIAFAALLFALPAHAAVNIDWVTVGDPGNACDTQTQGCFGAVAYEYRIGKYEVTNAQFTEFLNAVAATDTNGLYNVGMGNSNSPDFGGIARSGTSGSFSYNAIAGREDMPVNFVPYWSAARFANWLHNGQPTGAQDNTTTEDGAYTLTPTGIANNTVARNAGAEFFIASEDEWYKAAYYDPGAMIYSDYPAGSDTQTTCAAPGATANTANCNFAVASPTDTGSYTGSPSPSGTFDQGGNIFEWNETIVSGSERGVRGGAFDMAAFVLGAALRASVTASAAGEYFLGFRVAAQLTGQTDPGTNVVVEPNAVDENGDPVPGAPAITFDFDQVTGGGETTVTITETGPPPTEGLKLGNPPTYFDLGTTATFTGSVEVCIDYSGISYGGLPSNLSLSHFVGGVWVDVTTSNDLMAKIICGSVSSFSLFAIFEPVQPVPALGSAGLLALAAGLLGAFGYHRRRG